MKKRTSYQKKKKEKKRNDTERQFKELRNKINKKNFTKDLNLKEN